MDSEQAYIPVELSNLDFIAFAKLKRFSLPEPQDGSLVLGF